MADAKVFIMLMPHHHAASSLKHFLFSLVVLLLASAFDQVPSVTAAGGAAPVFLMDVANVERRTFELINDTRRTSGLRELEWNTDLYRMARAHSDNMVRYDFFSHTDPRGLGMVKRARLTGLEGWRALGENLAYNLGYSDPAAFAVDAWIESQKHRHNMMRPMFTHTAIGVAYMPDGRIFFTQVFGSK